MPPTHLRPLGLGEILDGAFTIYRRHFATLFSTGLIGFLPVVAYVGVVFPLVMMAEDEAAPWVEALLVGGFFVLFPLIVVATVVMWGALVREVSQAYLGGDVSVRDGFAHAWRRFFPLLGAMILWGLAVGAGSMLCLVPGVLLAIMFFAFSPAVMLEGKGPVESLGRSRQLAERAWGTIFLTGLVIVLISYIPGMGLGTAFMVGIGVAGAVGSDAAAMGMMVAYQVLSLVVSALTTPFIAAGVVLLYYDRRIRTEALDLELAAGELPGGAQGAV